MAVELSSIDIPNCWYHDHLHHDGSHNIQIVSDWVDQGDDKYEFLSLKC